ncbi:MAG: hypothetical protein DHS20C06_09890 [Hyphobacterium sp.]|nr:MAG: hypothetical protein DHS20C06_09890 [Hyphobacterium sp.]
MPDRKHPIPAWPAGGMDSELDRLRDLFFPRLDSINIAGLLTDPICRNTVIVSSFGAESAALLHYIHALRADLPVIFLDTGHHFAETFEYRDALAERLGLELIIVRPEPSLIAEEDPHDQLHADDPNACCTIRKTFPLQDVLQRYACWISGRKRYQSATRAALPLIERDGVRIKLNPLAFWTRDDINAYFKAHDLPRHPLEEKGYASIGCAPCTAAAVEGGASRSGRWPQMADKTECGIHLGPDGRFVRNRSLQTGAGIALEARHRKA